MIEERLPRGEYFLRVYPFNGAQNTYRVFWGNGQVGEASARQSDDIDIPDAYEDGTPGRIEIPLTFDVPAGSIIQNLRIVDLDINHGFLRDLRVSGQWDGVELEVFWNREGDANGRDGGLDDDILPFTGGDINFDNRDYLSFAGQPATGTFTLVIEDQVNDRQRDFSGELDNLEVEVTYLSPEWIS